jgi:hypothetical protein
MGAAILSCDWRVPWRNILHVHMPAKLECESVPVWIFCCAFWGALDCKSARGNSASLVLCYSDFRANLHSHISLCLSNGSVSKIDTGNSVPCGRSLASKSIGFRGKTHPVTCLDSIKQWAMSAGVFTPGSSNKVEQFTVEILDQHSPLYFQVFFSICFFLVLYFHVFFSICSFLLVLLFLLIPFLLSLLRSLSQHDLCVSTRR